MNNFFLSGWKDVGEKHRQGAITEGNKEKWGVKWYIHRTFWQRPVASSYIVDSQSLARYKRGQGPKYINGPAMALDRVIIGWETGLTLRLHELRSLSLMPFTEDTRQGSGHCLPLAWAWTRHQTRVFRVRTVLKNRHMEEGPQGPLPFQTQRVKHIWQSWVMKRVLCLEDRKRNKKMGKCFIFKGASKVMALWFWMLLKAGGNHAITGAWYSKYIYCRHHNTGLC